MAIAAARQCWILASSSPLVVEKIKIVRLQIFSSWPPFSHGIHACRVSQLQPRSHNAHCHHPSHETIFKIETKKWWNYEMGLWEKQVLSKNSLLTDWISDWRREIKLILKGGPKEKLPFLKGAAVGGSSEGVDSLPSSARHDRSPKSSQLSISLRWWWVLLPPFFSLHAEWRCVKMQKRIHKYGLLREAVKRCEFYGALPETIKECSLPLPLR